jgi:hypothetical protein
VSIVRVDVGTLLDPGAAAVPCRRGLRCLVSDVWPIVHVERAALIDDLADLTDGQWAHASLCGDWTLHDVAAHLINFVLASKPGDARYLLPQCTFVARAGVFVPKHASSGATGVTEHGRRPLLCVAVPPSPLPTVTQLVTHPGPRVARVEPCGCGVGPGRRRSDFKLGECRT